MAVSTRPILGAAELGTQPVLPARRSVAFVENEIDDLKHRGEPLREFLAAADLAEVIVTRARAKRLLF
jgi:hypothetical protein